jgi:hypothetical protein
MEVYVFVLLGCINDPIPKIDGVHLGTAGLRVNRQTP